MKVLGLSTQIKFLFKDFALDSDLDLLTFKKKNGRGRTRESAFTHKFEDPRSMSLLEVKGPIVM